MKIAKLRVSYPVKNWIWHACCGKQIFGRKWEKGMSLTADIRCKQFHFDYRTFNQPKIVKLIPFSNPR